MALNAYTVVDFKVKYIDLHCLGKEEAFVLNQFEHDHAVKFRSIETDTALNKLVIKPFPYQKYIYRKTYICI